MLQCRFGFRNQTALVEVSSEFLCRLCVLFKITIYTKKRINNTCKSVQLFNLCLRVCGTQYEAIMFPLH